MKKTDRLRMQVEWWNDYGDYVHKKSYIVDQQAIEYADTLEKEKHA